MAGMAQFSGARKEYRLLFMALARLSGHTPRKFGRNRGDMPYSIRSREGKMEIPV
jgi:hypothetical protein